MVSHVVMLALPPPGPHSSPAAHRDPGAGPETQTHCHGTNYGLWNIGTELLQLPEEERHSLLQAPSHLLLLGWHHLPFVTDSGHTLHTPSVC